MSKTYENQVAKAKMLAEGMKKHLNELAVHGVKQEALDLLISTSEEALKRSKEVDQLRMVVSEKAHEANAVLADVKAKYQEQKAILKKYYPAEQWGKFGLMDKR